MIQGLLYSIDLTGKPIALNLFGREKAKTRFGGICTILFVGFVLWAVYNVGYEIISALNPKTVSYEYYQDDPRPLTVSREIFPISIAMQSPTVMNYVPFKDESIVKVDISHTMVHRIYDDAGNNIGEDWKFSKIYTEECPKDYFSSQASGLDNIDFDTSYCIAKEQPELDKLEVQGLFSSRDYQAITISVSICDNDTSTIPCASEEKIKQYLSGAWFNVFYVNMRVNPQNYTSPNNTYKDLYYTMINYNSYRETEISLGYVKVDTDSGWLTESWNSKEYLKVNQIKEFVNTAPPPDGVMINCIIMSSQLETYYTRSYKKIQGVLAEAGSMANVVLVIMIFLVNPFMKLKFRESLMNELFDIRMPVKRRGNRKGSKKSTEFTPDSSPAKNANRNKERSKTTLNLLKSEMLTNLNSTQEFKGQDSGFLKSPMSPERQRLRDGDTEKKKSLFASSPRLSFSSHSQLPVLEQAKRPVHSIDLVLPMNPLMARSPSQREKLQETREDKPEKNNTYESKEDGVYENQLARIKSLKSELKRKGRTPILIDKRDSLKLKEKTLQDENSLHLSFPSNNSEGSDIESRDKKEDVDQYQIVKSEQNKEGEIEMENNPSVQDEKAVGQESPKKFYRGTTSIDIVDKEKDKEKVTGKDRIQLDTSIWEYVTGFMWKPDARKKQIEAFHEGLKHIDQRLDIVNLMKKLREVDKLRTLLLDPDQLVLFNNMPKPVIQLKEKKVLRSSVSMVQLEDLKFVFEETSEDQILDSINNLKSKPKKSEIDKKLIEMFENETFA